MVITMGTKKVYIKGFQSEKDGFIARNGTRWVVKS